MNVIVMLAALSGAIAVAAGAFGAHGASGAAVEWLKTGAHYQLVHAVAALVALRVDARGAAWLFVAGGAVFAGTLYLMALGLPRWLGAVTPIGGTLLIAGWLWLAWIGARA
ncbi:membrane protein [Sphingomonas endophytica]|uniref:Membrane protein n=2 Tax=Sphingomonas endophytica TaxID=869719 RepID=A0A147IAD5_9SPHN|nr:membrane protein [Sphingomonas endophytica]